MQKNFKCLYFKLDMAFHVIVQVLYLNIENYRTKYSKRYQNCALQNKIFKKISKLRFIEQNIQKDIKTAHVYGPIYSFYLSCKRKSPDIVAKRTFLITYPKLIYKFIVLINNFGRYGNIISQSLGKHTFKYAFQIDAIKNIFFIFLNII